MRVSLLACSAALWLDDDVAMQAIRLALPENDVTPELVSRVKRLGCVWRNWDGSWRLAEDVRAGLSDRLDTELPPDCVVRLRTRLASRAESRADGFSPDGQITNYRVRQACFEAAFQNVLIPGQTDQGAQQFANLWRSAPPAARVATASAADHLADEVGRRMKGVPPELLFLRGMAARDRGDRHGAERWFRQVWEQGKPGEIYAIASHLFGNMVRDRGIAERALLDAIEWGESGGHRGEVWHSLGNLLSRQPARWKEAEQAYDESLRLLHDPRDRGEVWHSVGNLLSRQPGRSREAEEAHHESLRLLRDPQDQGLVWHSLGNLLGRQPARWKQAEEAYHESLRLLQHDPPGQGQVWHSLGNLLGRQSGRWKDAEEAYHESLRLLQHDPPGQAQTYASWAAGLVNSGDRSSYSMAEAYARRALSLNPENPRHRSTVQGLLAKLYRASGRYPEAIEAIEAAMEADRTLKSWHLLKKREADLEELRHLLQGGGPDPHDAPAE